MASLYFILFPIFVLVSIQSSMSQELHFDLIIKDAKIIDGTGGLWFHGDVAVLDGKISLVGKVPPSSTATELIFANGSYLTPGFIDSHTHDDVVILENPSHAFKVIQGVTTVITGNCGFSNYPQGQRLIIQDHLRSLLGDVGSQYFFPDFASLNSTLVSEGMGLNVGSLVGHGPLRLATVGWDNRPATEEEIQAMTTLLDQQLSQGSLGLSLGLVYPPSSYANVEELSRLAAVVKQHGALISAHVRSYEGGLLSSIEEFLQVLRSSGARGLLSHLQAAGTPYWNQSIPQALELLEKARTEEGIDVAVDMYPYLAGSSTILQLLPPSAMSGGFDELLRNLENASYVDYLQNMTEGGTEPGWESKVALIGYRNIVIGSVSNQNLTHFEGITVVDGAVEMNTTEFGFLLQIITQDRGMTNIIMFQQSQDDNYLVFQSRLQMIGSDSIPRSGAGGGKPHPRGFGSFPRVIGRYAKMEGVLRLEEAIRKSTSATATRFGIHDRGLVVVGMKGDLVLFSEDILDQATFEDPTLPPRGIQGVWINGVRVVGEDGGLIDGVRPGEVVISGTEMPKKYGIKKSACLQK